MEEVGERGLHSHGGVPACMGLLLLPLGIGLCMAFAGVDGKWSKLLIWSSLSALLLGVLNSIRM